VALVIDTQAAAPGDPVAFWRDEAARVFQPLRVHPDDRSSFWARSVAHDLCGITLTRTCSVASTIVRTRDTIADGSYPLSRTLYIYVNTEKITSNPALKAFVDLYVSDDGVVSAVQLAGYVDLPDDQIVSTRSAWESAAA